MKELAAFTAMYEELCFCATFAYHGFSRECTIKPSRHKGDRQVWRQQQQQRIDDSCLLALPDHSDHEQVAGQVGSVEEPFIARVMVHRRKIGHVAGARRRYPGCALAARAATSSVWCRPAWHCWQFTAACPVVRRRGRARGTYAPATMPQLSQSADAPNPRSSSSKRGHPRPQLSACICASGRQKAFGPGHTFLNASLRLLLLSLPLWSLLSMGNMLILWPTIAYSASNTAHLGLPLLRVRLQHHWCTQG